MVITHLPTFAAYIKSRIKNNQNFIGMFVGKTGSGKTYGTLKLAQDVDPKFNVNRISFNPREAMEVINSGELYKGAAVVWEEVGVSSNSRNWQSASNKMINYLVQTFRRMNLVVLMSAPDFTFLDAGVRKLLHCLFETVKIDRKEKKVVVKPKLIQVNQQTGKMYLKYLRISTPNGVVPFGRLRLGLPEKELLKTYEQKKKEYSDNLNKSILMELNKVENARQKSLEIRQLTTQQREVCELLHQGKTVKDVCIIKGISSNVVYDHMRAAKKKGIQITAIRDNLKVKAYKVEGL